MRMAAMAAVSVVAACGTALPPRPGPATLPGEAPHLEERALLLLLVDRQLYEPFTVERLLGAGPALRTDLAAALGRIGDRQGRSVLEGLLEDAVPEVRREAAFALGELADARGAPALLRALRDPDRTVGVLAAEALGKIGAPLADVEAALEGLGEEERWGRLLPHLFRFRGPRATALAAAGLGVSDPGLHAQAAYALARDPRAEGVPALRTLLVDPDPRVRAWAARGLGKVGGGADLAGLRALLDEGEAGPVIQALRAAAELVRRGEAAPPEAWRERLRTLFDDPRPGVRVTALEASGAWLLDPDLGAALAARVRAGEPWESGVALAALARGSDPRAGDLAAAAAGAADPARRRAAVEAAALAGVEAVLERLAADPDPGVRAAALLALLGSGSGGLARRGLDDPDPAVRARVLGWLAAHPVLPYEALVGALFGSGPGGATELWQEGIRALVARGRGEAGERAAIVAALGELARDERHLVRRWAGEGLAELGEAPPPPGSVETRRDLEAYRQAALRSSRPRDVTLETSRGAIRIRLDCPRAPLTCLNFLQLARQGFYDGLTFHRVVPDFVVHGGDPRGDGWGGPGYTIRDEINRRRFGRGVLGMAHSGPDTAGSQFFLTLSPQPHLDGGYTAFGEVVGGWEVLDRIRQGDRIETVAAEEAPWGGGVR